MRKARFTRGFRDILLGAALLAPGLAQAQVTYLDQGKNWGPVSRKDFYNRDQGSQLIPMAWAKALKAPDGAPFLGDKLARYGFLPNPGSALPIGFTQAGAKGNQSLGLTCAACHTRDLIVRDQRYRVDGGPAITNFFGLLTDMIAAVKQVREVPGAFDAFAVEVLGPKPSAQRVKDLRAAVDLWYLRENTMRERSYPTDYWGTGRLDAVAMIFNRLTGLDIGEPPTYMIPDNIKSADAPVRYPFLWNAAIQDRTQWPGFSGNGTAVMGLSRNTGEVYGVFGTFHPAYAPKKLGNINFVANNSANWWGLMRLEGLVRKIGAPKWPAEFAVFSDLAPRGKQLYTENCASCHAQVPGIPGFPNVPTWRTLIQDVGTDSRECDVLSRMADPGVLGKMSNKLFKFDVKNPTKAFSLLVYSVLGSMVQSGIIVPAFAEDVLASIGEKKNGAKLQHALDAVEASQVVSCNIEKKIFPYESRVMEGIWAAAPYLHNGSVPTLDDLLKPANERPVSFAVGPYYDIAKLGLATQQPGWTDVRVTTGCDDRNSGNSRCGHEFGTTLSAADRRSLIEYLKML
ncbi:MAG: c-type cytochrome [Sphingomonadales bacterium]|nr:MAG: c-type cytochrome [Sphingomonadales bacterium]